MPGGIPYHEKLMLEMVDLPDIENFNIKLTETSIAIEIKKKTAIKLSNLVFNKILEI
jgi:hypothetical protein